MQHTVLAIIIFLYAATGVLSFVAYLPTIQDLLRKKSSANSASYVLWTATGVIGMLYGLFVLHDPLYNVVTFLHLVACAAILLLRLRLPR